MWPRFQPAKNPYRHPYTTMEHLSTGRSVSSSRCYHLLVTSSGHSGIQGLESEVSFSVIRVLGFGLRLSGLVLRSERVL